MKHDAARAASVTRANNKMITMRVAFLLPAFILVLISCRPTKKIQTAIIHKDTTGTAVADHAKEDSVRFIKNTYHSILANHVDYKTFSAKLNVDYIDADDRKYNVNANLRMYRDSTIWVSVNAIFGIEALRALITKD